jgi:hypothetical protein
VAKKEIVFEYNGIRLTKEPFDNSAGPTCSWYGIYQKHIDSFGAEYWEHLKTGYTHKPDADCPFGLLVRALVRAHEATEGVMSAFAKGSRLTNAELGKLMSETAE